MAILQAIKASKSVNKYRFFNKWWLGQPGSYLEKDKVGLTSQYISAQIPNGSKM